MYKMICIGTQSVRMPAPRSWSVPSFPMVLSHEALHKLLSVNVQNESSSINCSPLERFLGSILLRRHLQRFIPSEEGLHVSAKYSIAL